MTRVRAAGRDLEAAYAPPERAGAPVLVFLHEGLGSIALWRDFPAALARATGCGALVYSRYGNGRSEILREPRGVSYMHDEARTALPQVLAAFDIDDAILVGHSDGASIALIYAGEIGKCVRAVIALAPHAFVEDLSVQSIAQAKRAFESTDMPRRMARYHDDAARTFYGWNDIWLNPEFRAWNIRDAVQRIHVPVLLIQGADDEYGTVAQLHAIREDVREARVDMLLLARCGHAPQRDRSAIVTQTAAAFVRTAAS